MPPTVNPPSSAPIKPPQPIPLSEEQIRLMCLTLALEHGVHYNAATSQANKFYNFVTLGSVTNGDS